MLQEGEREKKKKHEMIKGKVKMFREREETVGGEAGRDSGVKREDKSKRGE